MVELFNIENLLEKVSYYVVQQIIKNEKHLLKIGESKDDDCRCEKFENVELLLSGIKQSLKKNGHNELVLTLKIDPEEFILESVCSIKNYDCCNDNWALSNSAPTPTYTK